MRLLVQLVLGLGVYSCDLATHDTYGNTAATSICVAAPVGTSREDSWPES
jgi:hypothetical protein